MQKPHSKVLKRESLLHNSRSNNHDQSFDQAFVSESDNWSQSFVASTEKTESVQLNDSVDSVEPVMNTTVTPSLSSSEDTDNVSDGSSQQDEVFFTDQENEFIPETVPRWRLQLPSAF